MTNHQLVVVATLAYVVSSISFVCTIITLLLIKVMKKWNGFLAILWLVNLCRVSPMLLTIYGLSFRSMALCQLIFDVSFSRHITSDSSWVSSKSEFTTELWDGLQFFGGLSVSLWTNVLAFVVVKVVVTFEGYNIRKNFYKLSAIVLIPSIAIGTLNVALYQKGSTGGFQDRMGMIYTYSRTLSIVINFVAYAIIAVRARKIANMTGEVSAQQLMINELSRRMIYYPLMQTVSRIGASLYEPLYGYGPYMGHTSNTEYGIACLYAITAPAAGIGYMMIFLAMQPYAYEQFVSILTRCKTLEPPEHSVTSSTTTARKFDAYSDNTSEVGTAYSAKTGSTGTGGSNGFGATLARGSGSGILGRVANAMGRSREDSVIKYLDDDELIKAIKESWKAATRRENGGGAGEDRVSTASSMQSSMYSRASEYTAGSASLSTNVTSSNPSTAEWSSSDTYYTANATRSPVHSTPPHMEL
jgi:hypothetical protein